MELLHLLTILMVCLLDSTVVIAVTEIWGDPAVLSHIKIDCASTSATVTYIGDPIVVLGFGAGRACVFKEDPENAQYLLNAVYEATNEEECVMMKRPNEKFYQIKLQARFTAENLEAQGDETVMLSCNFEPIQRSRAQTIQLREPFSEPRIVVEDIGLEARSTFSLSIRRLDGSLVNDGVTVGTEVELLAKMRPVPGEVAFRVFLCYADMPGEETSIPIIVDGCGTGTPFPENKGFVRFGNLARSPKLKLFRAVKTRPVGFRCEFIVCSEQCNQYSCPKEGEERTAAYRMERSLHEKSARKWAHSRNVKVFLHGEDNKSAASAVDLIMAEDREPKLNNTDDGNETWPVQSEHARHYDEASQSEDSSQRSTMAPKFLILTSLGGVLGLLSVVVGIWLACRFKRSSHSDSFQPPPTRNLTIGPPMAVSARYSEQFEELSL